jgi:hypothetical protein
MKRLRIAKSVGWLAEFPLDLWGLIVAHALGPDVDDMDAALALRLASVSRALCELVLPYCRTLLGAIIDRAQPRGHPDPGKRLSEQVNRFVWEIEHGMGGSTDICRALSPRYFGQHHTHLRRYLTLCATEYRKSSDHLINALSLVHFVQLERQARLHDLLSRHAARADLDSFMPQVVHFDGKRARLLRRMTDVWICCAPPDAIVSRARELCHDNNEEREHCALIAERDEARRLTLAMRVLERHNALCLKRPDGNAQFGHVVLKRDALGGVHHVHIRSDEASEFRAACYDGRGHTIAQATLACRLSAHHARNWHWLLESDRFKAPSQ